MIRVEKFDFLFPQIINNKFDCNFNFLLYLELNIIYNKFI